jgi:hypothetical protein
MNQSPPPLVSDAERMPNTRPRQQSSASRFLDSVATTLHLRSTGMTAEAILSERKMSRKMQHYSTMRIHLKRVQYSMEQEKRNLFYKELSLYLVFLFVLIFTICSLPVHVPYELNSAMTNLFVDQEFPDVTFKKTFNDVGNNDEIWQWVRGVLLEGYYDPPFRNTRRITSIEIRTGRVQTMSCVAVGPTNALKLFPRDACTDEFHPAIEEMTPYGNNGFNQSYQYHSDLSLLERSLRFTPSLWNARMDYGTGERYITISFHHYRYSWLVD